eukprot:612297-Prymnesium_polylepis.2
MLVPTAPGGTVDHSAGTVLSVSGRLDPSYTQVIFIADFRAAVAPLRLQVEQNTIARVGRLAFAVMADVDHLMRVLLARGAAESGAADAIGEGEDAPQATEIY